MKQIPHSLGTWLLTVRDTNMFHTSEKKLFHRIIDPFYEGGRWRKPYNTTLYVIYDEPSIIKKNHKGWPTGWKVPSIAQHK